MSSTLMENVVESESNFMLDPTAGKRILTYWPLLSNEEKAFTVAYIDNAYSITGAARDLALSAAQCTKMFRLQTVKRAISEVQDDLDGIDFLNEKWVKAQLVKIFPMVMGEEDIPMITNAGEQVMAKKFYPDIAMRVIEYVAPKKTAPTVSVTINNLNRLSDAQLEEVAMRGVQGNTYDNG